MITPIKTREYKGKKRVYKFIISFTLTVISIFLVHQIFFDTVVVSGSSMEHGISDGDIAFSIKKRFTELKRGDIVNIDSENLKEGIIKRIIGIEGDLIVIENGVVEVNGKPTEPYYGKTLGEINLTVPRGQVFVLGDNREHSVDSREIGCISLAEVRSKLIFTLNR